jgi:tetratricopeptide (TPR) repeat protein
MIEALLQAERLLLHGMVDQAEEIYRSAAERDPNNAIAVVGLARVALEHGDDQLALERARQALQIDPQNSAALRLEARLSEVLAARGEAGEHHPELVASPPASPTAPAAPPPAPSAAPSEQAVFTRNRSMAEARQLEERRAAEQPAAREPAHETAPEPQRRPGIVRRLLGK